MWLANKTVTLYCSINKTLNSDKNRLHRSDDRQLGFFPKNNYRLISREYAVNFSQLGSRVKTVLHKPV